MGLARQAGDSPAGDDSLGSVTLGDGNGVDHVVDVEDSVDGDGLLKVAVGKVDLLGRGASVDLDLHHVGLLLAEGEDGGGGVGNGTDDGAVLLHRLELSLNLLLSIGVLLGVLGEGLLLALGEVLVEPRGGRESSDRVISRDEPGLNSLALEVVREMLGKDGGE